MISLIYTSTASFLFSEDDIKKILNTSRDWNNDHGLSGLLLYKDGNIIQVLEGDEKEVEDIFEKIAQDPRHREVTKLSQRPITEREFQGWHMGFVDIGNLSDEELAGYSDFLTDESFDKAFLQSSPTRASILLTNFRTVMQ